MVARETERVYDQFAPGGFFERPIRKSPHKRPQFTPWDTKPHLSPEQRAILADHPITDELRGSAAVADTVQEEQITTGESTQPPPQSLTAE